MKYKSTVSYLFSTVLVDLKKSKLNFIHLLLITAIELVTKICKILP